MNRAGAPPPTAVAFTAAIVIGAIGVLGYSIHQHQDPPKVQVAPLPSAESTTPPAVAGPTKTTPSRRPQAPTPAPRTVSVGHAICNPSDYKLTLGPPQSTAGRVRYVLTASYRGPKGQKCLLLEYPLLSVDPKPGKDFRYLHPHGGVVEGYGQPTPTTLSANADALAYFQVENLGDGCARPKQHEVLRHIRMEGVPILDRLSKWCVLHESAWSLDPDAPQNADSTGIDTCRPYDLDVAHPVSVQAIPSGKRYQFTVVNTTTQTCVLNEFPHLTALWHKERRKLEVRLKPLGPQLELPGGASASGYLQVPSSCIGQSLDGIKVETIPLLTTKGKAFNLHDCAILESYWTVKR